MTQLNIVQRLIRARADHALAIGPGHPWPNTARVSPNDAAELRAWIEHINNDPWCPGSLTGKHILGMDIVEDHTVTGKPVVEIRTTT